MYQTLFQTSELQSIPTTTPSFNNSLYQSYQLVNDSPYTINLTSQTGETVARIPAFRAYQDNFPGEAVVYTVRFDSTVSPAPLPYVGYPVSIDLYEYAKPSMPGISPSNNVRTLPNDTSISVSSGSVTIGAGTVDATITQASGTTLAISSVGSITDVVQNQVVNSYLSDNSLVYFGSHTVTVANLTSGSQVGVPDIVLATGGFFDGILVLLNSSNGVNGQYTIVRDGILFNNMNGLGNYLFNETPTFDTATVTYTGGGGQGYAIIPFPSPTIFSDVALFLQNATTGTITSDNVTVSVYAMRAQVMVANTSMSPVQSQTSYQMTQTALGSFTVSGTSFTGTTAAQSTQTFPTDNLKTMHFMISVTNATGLSSTCQLQLALKSTMSSGGMLYDIGETNTYPTVFSIDGNANITWDNSVTPQMSSAYPYLALAIYLNNSSSTATTASCDVSITAMVNS